MARRRKGGGTSKGDEVPKKVTAGRKARSKKTVEEITNITDNASGPGKVEDQNTNKKDVGVKIKKGTESLKLADKVNLTRDDVRCPICWSILFEPTTMPCNHSLCGPCFKKSVEETSLRCPCCRLRISTWSRRAVKQKNLLDEKLWCRIQSEFPNLVAARQNNLDSQNVFECEENDEMPALTPESPSVLEVSSSHPSVLDGTLCSEPGELKQEYEQILQQHQNDLEQERLREETASADLIKQIQEEEEDRLAKERENSEHDFIVAKKLEEQLKAENMQSLKSNTSSQSVVPTPKRNLMREWIFSNNSSTAANGSPDICELSIKKIGSTPPSSLKKRLSNAKATSSQKKRISTSTATRASQEVMQKFLSSSQNLYESQFMFEEDQPKPSTSKSCYLDNSYVTNDPCSSNSIPTHDIRFSAFSPTKSSNRFNILNPSSGSLPVPMLTSYINTLIPKGPSSDEAVSYTKTPDSINSEVDRHFRPIKSAPKTPPRRRPDGTFLPEPKLLRMASIKPNTSSSVSAYIVSPSKQKSIMVTPATSSKPSCATIEKRISNDSGRASDTESRSPEIDNSSTSPGSSTKGLDNLSSNDRGCSSDDYRVTPEDIPTNSKKRLNERELSPAMQSSSKRTKVKTEIIDENIEEFIAPIVSDEVIKQEPYSPSRSDCLQTANCPPIKIELTCSQGVITIDDEDPVYLEAETVELEKFKRKQEQEAADRAFALQLQRELQNELNSTSRGRNSRERYSIRNWLKPEPRQTRSNNRKK